MKVDNPNVISLQEGWVKIVERNHLGFRGKLADDAIARIPNGLEICNPFVTIFIGNLCHWQNPCKRYVEGFSDVSSECLRAQVEDNLAPSQSTFLWTRSRRVIS